METLEGVHDDDDDDDCDIKIKINSISTSPAFPSLRLHAENEEKLKCAFEIFLQIYSLQDKNLWS